MDTEDIDLAPEVYLASLGEVFASFDTQSSGNVVPVGERSDEP